MKKLTKQDIEKQKEDFLEILKSGAIFVYPTDTIYGIGCAIHNVDKVRQLRYLKKANHPFSIIVPNKEWIYANCEVNNEIKKMIEEKLPGPYTFILKLKPTAVIPDKVNMGNETIGVRMVNHWIQEIVSELGIPIITTSANISGQDFIEEPSQLHPELKKHLDFVIDEGPIKGKPSKIIDVSSPETKILRE